VCDDLLSAMVAATKSKWKAEGLRGERGGGGGKKAAMYPHTEVSL
jgi:hypothetical protein